MRLGGVECELTAFATKGSRHLLVIPVINEGERLLGQLERIQALNCGIDVAIADGGSTDGSTELERLARLGVRALLVKRDAGKLSAQLRMAYGWALEEGYDGIITVDGNGKDGVDAIPRFAEALDAGHDYVQGSRYLPGGEAINTPPDRWLAGRLIHAPLISFGAGRWLTDTTNGFRAYSRKFLADREVDPFRDQFSVYNLLFYLSVRASRLGYSVTEIPVVRAYPDSGKTPTKIAGLRSRFALLGEAFDAATGGCTPPAATPQHSLPQASATILTVAVSIVLALVALVALLWTRMPMSPDSWSMQELAGTIGGDFFRVNNLRAYSDNPDYSVSFTPLWPVLMASARAVGLGLQSGIVLSALAFAGFCFASEAAARRALDCRWIGLAVAIALPLNLAFAEDLTGGRNFPMQLLLLATFLFVLLKPDRIDWRRGAALGMIGGLLALNRFDALPMLAVAGLGLWWLARSIRPALAYGATILVMLTPWMWHSFVRFGVPFKSDHGAISLTTDKAAYVTDWWLVPPANAVQQPLDWLVRLAGNVGGLPRVLWYDTGWSGFAAIALLIIPLAMVTALLATARPAQSWRKTITAFVHDHQRLAVFVIAVFALLAGPVLTGYRDGRYLTPMIWIATLVVAGYGLTWLATKDQRDFAGFAVLMLVLPFSLIFTLHSAWQMPVAENFPHEPYDAGIGACLGKDRLVSFTLFQVHRAKDAARLAALHGWKTAMEPRNFVRLSAAERRAFAERYTIRYAWIPEGEEPHLARLLPLAHVPGCSAGVMQIEWISAQ